jgi:hypothetical protein
MIRSMKERIWLNVSQLHLRTVGGVRKEADEKGGRDQASRP